MVYNPLASPHSSVISLPVSIYADFDIRRLDHSADNSFSGETMRVTSVPRHDASFTRSAEFALIFQTGLLPPVGAAIFKISTAAEYDEFRQSPEAVSVAQRELIDPSSTEDEQSSLEVSNGLFTVKFDR
jgi:hypothetical protein